MTASAYRHPWPPLRCVISIMLLAMPVLVSARAEIVPGRIDPPRTPRHNAAMLAGHTALYLCSGLFGSNISRAVVERDAMLDQFDRSTLPMPLEVAVDNATQRVLVNYLPSMPPRIAQWRPVLGCVQLPVGAVADAINSVPDLPKHTVAPEYTHEPWPQGDAEALQTLPEPMAGALAGVVEKAFDSRGYGGRTWGVVVVADGAIVQEQYARGYDQFSLQRTHSAAKSIAATVVGAAVQQGKLAVNQPAGMPEWQQPGDPRAQITLDHLLRMASGLYTEGGGNPQQEIYLAGAGVAERSATNLPDAPPGSRYVYAGSDTLLAMRTLRLALNSDAAYLRFPFEQLLWKIGMTRTLLETDWQGNFLMSGQVYATARDLARLGLLYLQDGMWHGEPILPTDWRSYVSHPGPAQPAGAWTDTACARDCAGRGYGAQFWLPKPGDGLPDGSFMASGGRGQYMLVVPAYNVVLVRRGTDVSKRHIDNEEDRRLSRFDIEAFARDVLAVLALEEN